MARNVIIQEIRGEDAIHGVIRALYVQWHAAFLAAQPQFQIQNIRFDHDPNWKRRFFSVQSVGDGRGKGGIVGGERQDGPG